MPDVCIDKTFYFVWYSSETTHTDSLSYSKQRLVYENECYQSQNDTDLNNFLLSVFSVLSITLWSLMNSVRWCSSVGMYLFFIYHIDMKWHWFSLCSLTPTYSSSWVISLRHSFKFSTRSLLFSWAVCIFCSSSRCTSSSPPTFGALRR